MKNCFAVLLLIGLSVGTILGQNRRPMGGPEKRKERIEAQRVAFLTQKLNLTPEESQKFWPIYNDHTNKEQELRRSMKDLREEAQVISETEADQALKTWIENGQKELDLRKNTYYQLRKVLPAAKLVKLPLAERQFKEKLLMMVSEKMQKSNK